MDVSDTDTHTHTYIQTKKQTLSCPPASVAHEPARGQQRVVVGARNNTSLAPAVEMGHACSVAVRMEGEGVQGVSRFMALVRV